MTYTPNATIWLQHKLNKRNACYNKYACFKSAHHVSDCREVQEKYGTANELQAGFKLKVVAFTKTSGDKCRNRICYSISEYDTVIWEYVSS